MATEVYEIGGQRHVAPALAAGLYVVATPIGNLADITLRALATLAACDLILCEDTRTSRTLLDRYAIATPRQAYHEHNESDLIDAVLARIGRGEAVALISDAGTPLISDPGLPLVRAARERGISVTALPGPSALLAALASAGLPTDRFTFIGFLPAKQAARARALTPLASRPETLVFYEAARRLLPTVAAMADSFGADRPAAIARELTKKFETHYAGALGELAGRLGGEDLKGEAVIVVGGATAAPDADEWRAALADLVADRPLKEAVDDIASSFDVSRREVYQAALALKRASDG
jgi:16S rRNA (cytidine1402-2'-O)-methyltransferase